MSIQFLGMMCRDDEVMLMEIHRYFRHEIHVILRFENFQKWNDAQVEIVLRAFLQHF